MNIYLAYKFKGRGVSQIKGRLEKVAHVFEEKGHQVFIYNRDGTWDEGAEFDPRELMTESLGHLSGADMILCLIDHAEPSEGMSIEVGYAKALKKQIVVCLHKDIKPRFVAGLADQVILYDDFEGCLKDIAGLL